VLFGWISGVNIVGAMYKAGEDIQKEINKQ